MCSVPYEYVDDEDLTRNPSQTCVEVGPMLFWHKLDSTSWALYQSSMCKKHFRGHSKLSKGADIRVAWGWGVLPGVLHPAVGWKIGSNPVLIEVG